MSEGTSVGTLDILERLVGFATVNAASNLGLVAYVEDFLQSRGFAAERFPDETGRKAGLFASTGPQRAAPVVLSGHTDVVPVEGRASTSDPFRLVRRDRRLFGRGTADMKALLAASLRAADRASRAALETPLALAFSYDEEIGCVGVRPMLDRLAAVYRSFDWDGPLQFMRKAAGPSPDGSPARRPARRRETPLSGRPPNERRPRPLRRGHELCRLDAQRRRGRTGAARGRLRS